MRDHVPSNNNSCIHSPAFSIARHIFFSSNSRVLLTFTREALATGEHQAYSSSSSFAYCLLNSVEILCHLLMSCCFLNTLKQSPCCGRAGGLNRAGRNQCFIHTRDDSACVFSSNGAWEKTWPHNRSHFEQTAESAADKS